MHQRLLHTSSEREWPGGMCRNFQKAASRSLCVNWPCLWALSEEILRSEFSTDGRELSRPEVPPQTPTTA